MNALGGGASSCSRPVQRRQQGGELDARARCSARARGGARSATAHARGARARIAPRERTKAAAAPAPKSTRRAARRARASRGRVDRAQKAARDRSLGDDAKPSPSSAARLVRVGGGAAEAGAPPSSEMKQSSSARAPQARAEPAGDEDVFSLPPDAARA